MADPVIFAVDDDPQVLRALVRDLRKRYRKDYKILSSEDALQALEALKELAQTNTPVALLLSDQRMPALEGVDYLIEAQRHHPDARRVLLTAYSDTQAAIRAINQASLDHYLLKPWDPPEEKLFPVLDDLLAAWHREFKPGYSGLTILGYPWNPQTYQLKDFLAAHLVPYRALNPESDPSAQQLLEKHAVQTVELPVVVTAEGQLLKQPEPRTLAESLGFHTEASAELYDVVVVGAGPAGLAAGVYGASEGLKTLLIDARAAGGQAGTSSRIENYLGFPNGLSGSELASRAITQAQRLGAEFLAPCTVTGLELDGPYKCVKLDGDRQVLAKAVIVATGMDYRRLPAEGCDNFSGAGVYYGAARTEAPNFRGQAVYVVGGGNSAGQAAMHLSKYAAKVNILIRGESLTATMSAYLIEQLENTPNVELRPFTEVVKASGDDRLRRLTLVNNRSDEVWEEEAAALFVFIGTRPRTEWLDLRIIKNNRGLIVTGPDQYFYPEYHERWPLEREPMLLETCIPGLFAAGDVRAGAMNRVASAVGEGSTSIKLVHNFLGEL